MRRTHLMACAAIVFTLAAAPAAVATPNVSVDAITAHQEALQGIADLNGGNRYTRNAGYTASAAYVKATLEKAGYDVRYEPFNMPIWREDALPVLNLTAPTSKTYRPGSRAQDNSPDVDFIAFEHSPTKEVSAEVVTVGNTEIPADGNSTSGCVESDFGADVKGNIALIQRGTCAFTAKLQNALKAEAVGVILFNEGDTAGRRNALFRSADPGYPIPAVLSSYDVGKELYDLAKGGQHPTVTLGTSGVDVEQLYPNVVAETKGGDPNHMVFLGAHLDSVPAGPGVNDDGSGTSFQLALAEELAKKKNSPKNKIRFLWFGGEEDGLVGSQYYAAHLSDAEVARTDMMLDTDMISSSNFARLVYDGDGSTFGADVSGPPGSGKIEKVLREYWADKGLESEPIPFDGRSDYVGFVNRGIPSGGVFSGAEAPKTAAQVAKYGGVQGEQLDPCYHEACDNFATLTGQPPAETMEVFDEDPALAQQQADSLNGNALRSLRQFKDNLVHATWFFANAKNQFPKKATAAKATKTKRTKQFKVRGHRRVAR